MLLIIAGLILILYGCTVSVVPFTQGDIPGIVGTVLVILIGAALLTVGAFQGSFA